MSFIPDIPVPTLAAPVSPRDMALLVLDAVTSHPNLHDQACWGKRTLCSSTLCAAGWACHLDPRTVVDWTPIDDDDDALVLRTYDITDTSLSADVSVPNRAATLMGLDPAAQDKLFLSATDNTARLMLANLVRHGSPQHALWDHWLDVQFQPDAHADYVDAYVDAALGGARGRLDQLRAVTA